MRVFRLCLTWSLLLVLLDTLSGGIRCPGKLVQLCRVSNYLGRLVLLPAWFLSHAPILPCVSECRNLAC